MCLVQINKKQRRKDREHKKDNRDNKRMYQKWLFEFKAIMNRRNDEPYFKWKLCKASNYLIKCKTIQCYSASTGPLNNYKEQKKKT